MALPRSCGCVSLRAASFAIGLVVIVMSSLYVVLMMAQTILVFDDLLPMDANGLDLVHMVSINYLDSQEIAFSAILLYGTIKGKSCCVLAWLICQVAVFSSTIINVIVCIFTSFALYLDAIILILIHSIAVFIVFCYYNTLEKPEAA